MSLGSRASERVRAQSNARILRGMASSRSPFVSPPSLFSRVCNWLHRDTIFFVRGACWCSSLSLVCHFFAFCFLNRLHSCFGSHISLSECTYPCPTYSYTRCFAVILCFLSTTLCAIMSCSCEMHIDIEPSTFVIWFAVCCLKRVGGQDGHEK